MLTPHIPSSNLIFFFHFFNLKCWDEIFKPQEILLGFHSYVFKQAYFSRINMILLFQSFPVSSIGFYLKIFTNRLKRNTRYHFPLLLPADTVLYYWWCGSGRQLNNPGDGWRSPEISCEQNMLSPRRWRRRDKRAPPKSSVLEKSLLLPLD